MPLLSDVLAANLEIGRRGLAALTWGNASGVDRGAGVLAIKPSGVDYGDLDEAAIVVVSLETGAPVRPGPKPSSDLDTHLLLAREFPEIGGIVHTHSPYAVAWAQAGRDLPCLGTTHADHFAGDVPCTRALTAAECGDDYVRDTGAVIVETFRTRGLDPGAIPGVLVRHHGPFVWGPTPAKAMENAVALEEIARMAWVTLSLAPDAPAIPEALLARHHRRKHGPDATYGQG